MAFMSNQTRFALVLSVAIHAVALALAFNHRQWFEDKTDVPKDSEKVVYLQTMQAKLEQPITKKISKPTANPKSPSTPRNNPIQTPIAQHTPTSMAAPAAPTAQEWAFAATYINKNSKGYRYYWGQQVRSMMGTAVEGPDQGMVRFRLEISPQGTLTKLETLWSTSAVAEQLARKAIANMPPLPPTPTGKPLIFEKTIAFTPYAVDGPPMYKNDCLPDSPAYQNPFAWDGKSPQVYVEAKQIEPLTAQALADCLKQLPPDSIDAEMANTKGKMDRWGWTASPLNR